MKHRAASANLVKVLNTPEIARSLDDPGWSTLIAVARKANLLGALAERLSASHVSVQAQATRHLDGARQLSLRQRRSVLWEVHQLQSALGKLKIPVLLLKGAAYVMSQEAVAKGRLFGDIDILVPKSSLGDVESQLMLHGWVSAKTSAYDQRYYRQWMHEIPPMQHIHRSTVVDVHHTILPPTARYRPDPEQIIARSRAVTISGLENMRTPCQEDLVIHSITHLVHEGELNNGLRDLADIDGMLRNFGNEPGFWSRLCEHTAGNDLAQPVVLGLRLVRLVFDTPIPERLFTQLTAVDNVKFPTQLLESIYQRALHTDEFDVSHSVADFCRWLIYVRSHALRMPPLLLIRHLTIKAWMGWFESRRANASEGPPEN